MTLKIHEVAQLTGVTVRTLQYYDKIGLLQPEKRLDSGYRIYKEEDILKLQQIMFFKELDFPLEEIKLIMENPNYNRAEAIKKQHEMLRLKRDRLNQLLCVLEKEMGGNHNMSFKEFNEDEILKQREQYKEEVQQRYGKTKAYQEFSEKKYDNDQWKKMSEESDEIMRQFAVSKNMNLSASDESVQNLVEQWRTYITNHYYTCTKEILSGLGQMYVGDERFTKNIDQHGEGTAQFMADAIAVYVSN